MLLREDDEAAEAGRRLGERLEGDEAAEAGRRLSERLPAWVSRPRAAQREH